MSHNLATEPLYGADRPALIQAISDGAGITHVNTAIWACIWLADTSSLRNMLQSIKENDGTRSKIRELLQGDSALNMLRLYTGQMVEEDEYEEQEEIEDKITAPAGPVDMDKQVIEATKIGPDGAASETSTNPTKRHADTLSDFNLESHSKMVCIAAKQESLNTLYGQEEVPDKSATDDKKCWTRDLRACILTRAPEPLTAAPSPDTVSRWRLSISKLDGTHGCSTLLTLSTHLAQLWSCARFALRPNELSLNGKSLNVQFFWLPDNAYSNEILLTTLPQIPSDLETGPEDMRLFDSKTGTEIYSRTCLKTVTTEDPESYPLPSVALLEMQWIFNRAVALSGVVHLYKTF
ncbi:hypothetical protein BJY04DRAFT_218904 [Aspergillus karnatakaensis]|uniref:uncharacterized protein n=1 Tax=Aspergillus karnatakaensis TaxID=1810916 RepID=UPI003CCE0E7C